MAIRASFLALTAFFSCILPPGAPWPASAEPQSSPSDLFELSAVSPTVKDPARPAPSAEPKRDDSSSQDDASVWVPADFDPWAYAFAESSRLQGVRIVEASYPVVMNHHVKFFVDRFTSSRRDLVGLWLRRSGRYLEMIRGAFRAKGLPEDLAFTAMIESGFDPLAVSRVGAKGLWQFMAPTARLYGLRVDRWVDERLDPEKSTVAAAAYLRDLHVRYGSWELAQAAYNAGAVKVDKAMRATGSGDFWDLTRSRFLRRETKDFVPAIQAATLIGRDPGQYGFEPTEATTTEVERVTVPPSTDLRKLSVRAEVPLQTLRTLNPVLVRGVTPPGTTWEVRVPEGTRESILAALTPRKKTVSANGAGRRAADDADVHVVRPRDTVGSIAKRYGVSISDVVRWNNLDNRDAIRPGERLRVTTLSPSVELDGQGGFR